MANGHLLAAPDRIVTNLEHILEQHDFSCEHRYSKECNQYGYLVDLTVLTCKNDSSQIDIAIEKQRDRIGADIVLIPKGPSLFRRDLDSEALANRIAEILCLNGASEDPNARCEDLD